jgi:hypothetical protein
MIHRVAVSITLKADYEEVIGDCIKQHSEDRSSRGKMV